MEKTNLVFIDRQNQKEAHPVVRHILLRQRLRYSIVHCSALPCPALVVRPPPLSAAQSSAAQPSPALL
ncbi:hypothetical protein L2E82_36470 [Cichorium intybus]|uniref:Uncharacterized protein n=1 Tax=Cichorium intybus TaxID=13427 RepID=A0ACB9BRM7_CICIN|nr:hypothetical protein L2E82_36470 [Cichorium intybus]